MTTKTTLRERRRAEREARARRQRLITAGVTLAVIVVIGLIAFNAFYRNNQANKAAEATTAAQMVLNTSIAATQTASPTATPLPQMTFPGVPTDTVKTTSGLQYKDLVVGTGAEARSGSTVNVYYTGWLTNGTKFDSSNDHPPVQPFSFAIGAGNVIKGWDEGVTGMKAGGKRILVIPPELGYGAAAQGSIPANSTLIFEVDLPSVQ